MTAYNIIAPSSMQAGQPEDVSVILANLQAIAAVINGGIDNANINPAAALAISKLAGYPSDGAKFLQGDGVWAAPPAPPAPLPPATYGTSLPASPADGNEHILVDSLTAPGYQWRFRWNAGNTTGYKWEFIGGAPMTNSNAGAVGFTNGGYALPGIAVGFTPPRPGVYDCRYTCMVDMVGANTNGERWYTDWGGAGQSPASGNLIYVGPSSDQGFFVAREQRLTLNSASALQMYFRVWQGTGGTISHQSLSITPLRVS